MDNSVSTSMQTNLTIHCHFCFYFWERVSLYSPGWPGTLFVDPPISVSWVLNLIQALVSSPSPPDNLFIYIFCFYFIYLFWLGAWGDVEGNLRAFSTPTVLILGIELQVISLADRRKPLPEEPSFFLFVMFCEIMFLCVVLAVLEFSL